MKPILILYATREGQTGRIAEHIAAAIRARGFAAEVADVARVEALPNLGLYGAAILASPVHDRRHEPALVEYARSRRAALERMPTAFLSVTLAEAVAEAPEANHRLRTAAALGARRLIDAFIAETGWHPTHVKPVAGALAYTHYVALTRFTMMLAAKCAHLPTATDRDHELSDWAALDRFVDEFLVGIAAPTVAG